MGWFTNDDDNKKDNKDHKNDSAGNYDKNCPNEDTGGDYASRTKETTKPRDTKGWDNPTFLNH